MTFKRRRRLGLKRKKPRETRQVRANIRNRCYQKQAREIKRREFREEYGRKLSLKWLAENKPICVIVKLHKEAMRMLEGTNYA